MPTTYNALNSANPGDYLSCAQQWGTLVNDFDGYLARYQQSVSAPVNNGTWTGAAADTAKKSVHDSYTKIATTRTYVDAVSALLTATAHGIDRARQRLLSAVSIAAAASIPIDSNGRITPDLAITMPVADWNNPPILAGMKAQNMICQALQMADAVNGIINPLQLNYANKLSPTETGAWRTDADTDHQNALAADQNVQDTLTSIAVDEKPWRDVQAQPYNTEQGNPGDWARYQFLRNVGVPGLIATGRPHAAWAFSNFLDNTGTPAPINPEHVMNDVPKFQNLVLNAVAMTQGNYVLDTGWTNTNVEDDTTGLAQSQDWYYTMNDFRYRVVGRGYINGDQQIVDYSVAILKPYEFGDSVMPDGTVLHRNPVHLPGGGVMDQKDIQRLHTVGLAQNFIIQGVTHFRTTYSISSGTFNPTTTTTESDPWPTL
jgi:hypothetical protein